MENYKRRCKMKGVNRMNGFSRHYYGNKFVVRFREYAARKVVCEIEDMYAVEIFKGVARCHKVDTFDLIEGRKLAFKRAMAKRDKYYEGMMREYMREYLTNKENIRAMLIHRFERLCEKIKGE